MRNKLLLLVFIFIVSAQASLAQMPSYVPTNGLVGWWPFNGNANDESGNGNNGTVNGASLSMDRFGNPNAAYYFNGTNNDISVLNSFYPVGSDHTISIWFLVADSNRITNTLYNTSPHRFESMGYNTYFLTQPYGFSYCIGDGVNWNPCGSGASFYPTFIKSNWNNIVYVKSGQTWKFYLNGNLVHTYIENNSFSPTTLPVNFGSITCCSGEYYKGKLDDIGIWNRALTQQEITNLYNGTTPSVCNPLPPNLQTGLVGYWPFCGNSNDESGNGNNGVVNGATLTNDRFGHFSSAYSFNAFNWGWGTGGDFIYIPYNAMFNSSNISLSVWFCKSSNYISNQINPSIVKRFEGGYSNPNGQTWGIYANTNGDSLGTFILPPNSTNNYSIFINQVGPVISNAQWHNAILVFDGISMKTYFDGSLVSTKQSSGFVLNTNGNSGISVGMSVQANGNWDPFNGQIDDLGIWNRALSSVEIQQLYQSQSPCSLTTNFFPQDTIRACGASVSLDALNPGSTYSWNTGAATQSISVTNTGWYRCTVAQSSCSAMDSVFVSLVNSEIVNNDTTICDGTIINISTTGASSNGHNTGEILYELNQGFTYPWQINWAVIQGASYILRVEGVYGITTSSGIDVDAAFGLLAQNPYNASCSGYQDRWRLIDNCPARPTPDTYNSNHVYYYIINNSDGVVNIDYSDCCYGDNSGSLNFKLYNYTGNITYNWSNGSTATSISVSPTQTTTYYCTVSNGISSCTDSVTITVNNLSNNLFAQDTVRACGANYIIDAGAGYSSYLWNTGATTQTISATSTGWYRCTVGQGNCSTTDSVFISLVNAEISNSNTTVCAGSNLVLSAAQSSQINSSAIYNSGTPNPWNYPSPADGGYIPLGTFGTPSVFSISCYINPSDVQAGIAIIMDCNHGGNLNWVIQNYPNISSGSNWSFGALQFTLVPNTWQHLLITYNNGQKKAYVNGVLQATAIESINWSGNPGLFLGNWPEGARRFHGGIDELYITYDLQQTNNFSPLPRITSPSSNTFGLWHFDEAQGITTSKSDGTSYSLNNWNWVTRPSTSSSVSYLWSTGETSASITVSPNQTATYILFVTDGVSTCADSVLVTVNNVSNNLFAQDTIRVCGTSYVLDAGIGYSSYAWNTGGTTQSVSVSSTGWYRCAVISGTCNGSDSLFVSLVNAQIVQNDTTICTGGGKITLSAVGSNGLSANCWQQVSAPSNEYLRIVKANNGNYFVSTYQGSQAQLYTTSNFNTWVSGSNPLPNGLHLMSGKTQSGKIFLSSSHNGVYASTNNGANWLYVFGNGFGCAALDFEESNSGTLFISLGGFLRGIYKSTDDGVNWSNRLPGLDIIDIEWVSGTNTLFASAGQLWKSTDMGDSWVSVSSATFSAAVGKVESIGSQVIVFTIDGKVYRSLDMGNSWTLISTIPFTSNASVYCNDFVIDNQGNWWLGMNSQGVWRSSDNGTTWNSFSICLVGEFRYFYLEGSTLLATTNTSINKLATSTTSYLWSNGATTPAISVSANQTTTYYCTVSNGISSCTDSVRITVNQPTSGSQSISACSSYNWQGSTYTQSGNYTRTLTNAANCDSTAILNLTINQPSSGSSSVTACGSYTWQGTTYTQSGSYTRTLTNAANCDSTATLNLTINQPSSGSSTVTACGSYTWQGTTYTQSGSYTRTLTNTANCDSTATLNLTINQPSSGSSTVTACGSYTWQGTTYTQSGSYTRTLTNAANCDSTATLNLTIQSAATPTIQIISSASGPVAPGTSITFTATITSGGSSPVYQWKKNGSNVGANSATYTDTQWMDGDIVTCTLTSNATCITTSTVTSNSIIVQVISPNSSARFLVVDVTQNRACYYDSLFNFVTSNILSTNILYATTNVSDVVATPTRVYVLDGVNSCVYQSSSSNTVALRSRTLRTNSGGKLSGSTGLTLSGDTLWVLDPKNNFIYRYSLSSIFSGSGTVNAQVKITLSNTNSKGEALWNDAGNLYVLNNGTTKTIYRYNKSGGTPTISKALSTANGGTLSAVTGMTVRNGIVYVTDRTQDKVYPYSLSSLYTGTGTLNASAIYQLNLVNLDPTGVTVVFNTTTARIVNEPTLTMEPSEVLESSSLYPNPTSGDVTIRYFAQQTGFAYAAIYNLNGQLMFQSDKTPYEQGENQLVLPIAAESLPNGVYFVRLFCSDRVDELRLIIAR